MNRETEKLILVFSVTALGMWGQYWKDRAMRHRDAIEYMIEEQTVVIPDDLSELE